MAAAQILAVSDEELTEKLRARRRSEALRLAEKDEALQKTLANL